jgi:hypothetical protein
MQTIHLETLSHVTGGSGVGPDGPPYAVISSPPPQPEVVHKTKLDAGTAIELAFDAVIKQLTWWSPQTRR